MKLTRLISNLIRLAVTVALIWAGYSYFHYLVSNPPEVRQRPTIRTLPVVQVEELKPADYDVTLPSYGLVKPHTETELAAEVSGRIAFVSGAYREGKTFQKDDILLKIDPRNYEASLARAEADLVRTQTALSLAEAQTEKAKADWERLGRGGQPSDLTLRLPQLKEAQAAVSAAQADRDEAALNLQRCEIKAPYNGVVLEKTTDLGDYVTPGKALGRIFASDYAEVRLPLREDQFPFFAMAAKELHETSGDSKEPDSSLELTANSGDSDSEKEGDGNGHGSPFKGPEVDLRSGDTRAARTWSGWIDRTEGSIDASTRQLFVVARIPLDQAESALALPEMGLFVSANIDGPTLKNVFLIPRQAVRGGDSVIVIDEDKRVRFRKLDIVYEGDPNYLVVATDSLLKTGDRVSLTPLPFAVEGDQVRIEGEEPPSDGKGAPGSRGPRPDGAGSGKPAVEGGKPRT